MGETMKQALRSGNEIFVDRKSIILSTDESDFIISRDFFALIIRAIDISHGMAFADDDGMKRMKIL